MSAAPDYRKGSMKYLKTLISSSSNLFYFSCIGIANNTKEVQHLIMSVDMSKMM